MTKLEKAINYQFSNIQLLKRALTHSSIDNINSYERLEFLGDSIINNIVSNYLFNKFPALKISSKDCSRSITVLRIYSFPASTPA